MHVGQLRLSVSVHTNSLRAIFTKLYFIHMYLVYAGLRNIRGINACGENVLHSPKRNVVCKILRCFVVGRMRTCSEAQVQGASSEHDDC